MNSACAPRRIWELSSNWVPAGPFLFGNPTTGLKTCSTEDFAIQEYPVTAAQYAAFLEAIDKADGQEAAALHLPRSEPDGPYYERTEDGRYELLPILVEGAARAFNVENHGEDFGRRLPVVGITIDDALAFCRWKTETTGSTWRLPTEEEWEKFARGVDGRPLPWGTLEDASLAKCRTSRECNPQLEPVGAFPTARSVYGVADVVGNIWEWTTSWFDAKQDESRCPGWSLERAGFVDELLPARSRSTERAAFRNRLSLCQVADVACPHEPCRRLLPKTASRR